EGTEVEDPGRHVRRRTLAPRAACGNSHPRQRLACRSAARLDSVWTSKEIAKLAQQTNIRPTLTTSDEKTSRLERIDISRATSGLTSQCSRPPSAAADR